MVVLLSGCTLPRRLHAGPDFVEPNPHLPDNADLQRYRPYRTPICRRPPIRTGGRMFGDPILTNLESRIADANLDVRTATIRIAESRYQRGVTAAAELPSINGDAKYQRELYSKNGIISLYRPPARPGRHERHPHSSRSTNIRSASTCPGSSTSGAACAGRSSPPMRRSTRRRIDGVTRWYRALRSSRATTSSFAARRSRSGSPKTTSKVDREVLQLAQQLQQKGVRSGLDAENAAAQVEGISAQLPSLQQQEIQYQNAIALLLDLPPTALNAELSPRRRDSKIAASRSPRDCRRSSRVGDRTSARPRISCMRPPPISAWPSPRSIRNSSSTARLSWICCNSTICSNPVRCNTWPAPA